MNQLFGLQHRGDRYLSHNSRHTQVPVPATTIKKLISSCGGLAISPVLFIVYATDNG